MLCRNAYNNIATSSNKKAGESSLKWKLKKAVKPALNGN
jgi:hypothetical protein